MSSYLSSNNVISRNPPIGDNEGDDGASDPLTPLLKYRINFLDTPGSETRQVRLFHSYVLNCDYFSLRLVSYSFK